MKDNSFYTKLIYEYKIFDRDYPYVASVSEPTWEADGNEFMEMFYKIWVIAGYNPDGFTKACEYWVEEHKEYE